MAVNPDQHRQPNETYDAGVEPGDKRSRLVLTGSLWYLAATAIMAAGGFVAWALAARIQPIGTVGAATALFASTLFVVYGTGMGLPVAVARFAHGEPDEVERLWSWAVAYAAVASAVGTGCFVLLGPRVLGTAVTGPLSDLTGGWLLFFALALGMSWAALSEMRFMTMRSWAWVVGRVGLVVAVRLPLLVTPLASEPLGLLVIMAGPPAVSGFLGVAALALRRAARRAGHLWPAPRGLADAWRYATVNWVGTLAAQAPQFVAPLVVAATVPAADNAGFYLAWSITTVVFLIAHTIGQVVVSEASRSPGQLRRHVRSGLELGLALSGGIALVLWAGASLATIVFGSDYGATAAVLPRLCAAAIPWTITSLCLAVTRVRNDWAGTFAITGAFAALTLAPMVALVGPHGVIGASTGWLLGNVAASVVAGAVVFNRERRRVSKRAVTVSAVST
jgi:O-antigen/teichoic acid export membrane protein